MTLSSSFSIIAFLPAAQVPAVRSAARDLIEIPEVTRVGLTIRSPEEVALSQIPIEAEAVLTVSVEARDRAGLPGSVLSMFKAKTATAAWLALSRTIRERMIPPPAGEQPGRKMLAGIRRRDPLSPAAFNAYWRDEHAPLALHHHVGLLRYIQHELIEVLTPNAPELDGFGELDIGPGPREKAMYGYPDSAKVITEDVQKFVQPPSLLFFGTEYVFR